MGDEPLSQVRREWHTLCFHFGALANTPRRRVNQKKKKIVPESSSNGSSESREYIYMYCGAGQCGRATDTSQIFFFFFFVRSSFVRSRRWGSVVRKKKAVKVKARKAED
jgi:hypothetical protein